MWCLPGKFLRDLVPRDLAGAGHMAQPPREGGQALGTHPVVNGTLRPSEPLWQAGVVGTLGPQAANNAAHLHHLDREQPYTGAHPSLPSCSLAGYSFHVSFTTSSGLLDCKSAPDQPPPVLL